MVLAISFQVPFSSCYATTRPSSKKWHALGEVQKEEGRENRLYMKEKKRHLMMTHSCRAFRDKEREREENISHWRLINWDVFFSVLACLSTAYVMHTNRFSFLFLLFKPPTHLAPKSRPNFFILCIPRISWTTTFQSPKKKKIFFTVIT